MVSINKYSLSDVIAFLKEYKVLSKLLRTMGKTQLANSMALLGFGKRRGKVVKLGGRGANAGQAVNITMDLYRVIARELKKPSGQRKGIISLVKELRLLSQFMDMYGKPNVARVLRLIGFGKKRKMSQAQLLKKIKALNKKVFRNQRGCGKRVLSGRVDLVGTGFFSFIKKQFNGAVDTIKHPKRAVKRYVKNFVKHPLSSSVGLASGFLLPGGYITRKIGSKAIQYGVKRLTGRGRSYRPDPPRFSFGPGFV